MPVGAGRKPLSAAKKTAVIEAIEETGSMDLACARAEVDRSVIYRYRKVEPEFNARFLAAMATYRSMVLPDLQSRAVELALHGVREYVTCGKGLILDPDTGKPLMQVRWMPGHIVKLLEKFAPETFAPKQEPSSSVPEELLPDPEPTPDEPAPARPIA